MTQKNVLYYGSSAAILLAAVAYFGYGQEHLPQRAVIAINCALSLFLFLLCLWLLFTACRGVWLAAKGRDKGVSRPWAVVIRLVLLAVTVAIVFGVLRFGEYVRLIVGMLT